MSRDRSLRSLFADALVFWLAYARQDARAVALRQSLGGALGMAFPGIVISARQLVHAAGRGRRRRLRKSRQRVCRQGLVSTYVIDKNSHKMSVCIRPAPPGSKDPLHHARSRIAGMTHVIRFDHPDGETYLATHGVPDRSSMGKKIRMEHLTGHFQPGHHAVLIHPESHALGHSPRQAYEHAISKHAVRTVGGDLFGLLVPEGQDAKGNPTAYRFHRAPAFQHSGRLAKLKGQRHTGQGTLLSPVQVAYLKTHPPQTGVAVGHAKQPIAKWTHLTLPALDGEGHVIPGRPPEGRYDVMLDPSLYGGERGFKKLKVRPGWTVTDAQPAAEAQFREYLQGLRQRVLPREADRQAKGGLDELLERHDGDVDALLASGDLGHKNRKHRAAGSRQQRIAPEKRISDRDAEALVFRWKRAQPEFLAGLRKLAARHWISDDAAVDNVVDDAVRAAVHRFDPGRNVAFSTYARSLARSAIQRAIHERGQAHAAEARASGGATTASPAPRRTDQRDADYKSDAGSQATFQRVLADAFPDDESTRRVMATLYPTGDFGRGGRYKEASLHTGIPIPELMAKKDAAIARVRRHPAYRRYYEAELQPLDERRLHHELERSMRRGEPQRVAELLEKALKALREELEEP